MKVLVLFSLFLATTVATSHAKPRYDHIKLLRPRSGAGHRIDGVLDCLSWRLAVETNNLRTWDVVPADCEDYVGNYMLGSQYRKDCDFAAAAAYDYAKNVTLAGDGKDIWVFDIDETSLSNLPYYAQPDNGFGAKEFNETSFDEWEAKGIAPAVPAVLELYKKLLALNIKVVFISGKGEAYRNVTETNMKAEGYTTWEKLVLKAKNETGTAVLYKSTERTKLVNAGYRIIGNMGDQWSDIMGQNVGERTFKLPDPISEEYNSTSFNEWAAEGIAPALPESLRLYKNLITLGIQVVFLTGRWEDTRNATTTNLIQQGYTTMEKLILKNETYANTVVYKAGARAKLVDARYRIVGNMGDQWTDLLGSPSGDWTFKLPDPMYYIS